MFKFLKLAAIVGAGVLLAGGSAQATAVPAGTLSIAFLGDPTVNNTGGTITASVPTAYFSGTGSFAPFTGSGNFTTSTFTFAETVGALVNYSTNSIANFFTFTGGGDTYTFSLDQSIQTVSYSYNSTLGTGQVGLYILGDLTATGSTPYTTLTPTAFSLTLNDTGGSGYSASATLANPPPGSGIPTPEPASMTLLGGGLAALGFVRRRRQRRQ
jgi:hypothetical protein